MNQPRATQGRAGCWNDEQNGTSKTPDLTILEHQWTGWEARRTYVWCSADESTSQGILLEVLQGTKTTSPERLQHDLNANQQASNMHEVRAMLQMAWSRLTKSPEILHVSGIFRPSMISHLDIHILDTKWLKQYVTFKGHPTFPACLGRQTEDDSLSEFTLHNKSCLYNT